MYKINKLQGYIVQIGKIAIFYNKYKHTITFKNCESLLYIWNLHNIALYLNKKNFESF